MRRVTNGLVAVLFATTLGAVAFWIGSGWACGGIARVAQAVDSETDWTLYVVPGSVVLWHAWYEYPAGSLKARPAHWSADIVGRSSPSGKRMERWCAGRPNDSTWGTHYSVGGFSGMRGGRAELQVRDVTLAATNGLALTLTLLVVGRRRARSRCQSVRCLRCGYDLRASPGRCPECGADRG